MRNVVFNCRFADSISTFVEHKQELGFPYESSTRILAVFDKFVQNQFPESKLLSGEICHTWATLRPNEHPNGLLRRVTPIRQLGKFMAGCGLNAYILPGYIPSKQIHYVPHIYTEGEIHSFFSSVDSELIYHKDPARNLIVPLFFRLLYCCGLRASEVRKLLVEDVNLETGRLYIRESKGWESRSIFMAESIRKRCSDYDMKISIIRPGRDAFFPSETGGFLPEGIQDYWFHRYWDHLPESEAIKDASPRVHDFRHTFAVNTLTRWVKQSKDLNALYPYLSEYLGHRHYTDSDYYLHLVSEFYPEMENRLDKVNKSIIPEVPYENM